MHVSFLLYTLRNTITWCTIFPFSILFCLNWIKVTTMRSLVITQVQAGAVQVNRLLRGLKSCISVTLTRLALLERYVWNGDLRNAWHVCDTAFWRLFNDRFLQMTGISAKKIPEGISRHKPCKALSLLWGVYDTYPFDIHSGVKIYCIAHRTK